MKNFLFRFISSFHMKAGKLIDRMLMYCYRAQFGSCGKNVKFFPTLSDILYSHVYVGNDVFIGPGASIIATVTSITIGNKVMIAPNVTIRGGNHASHIVGKFMMDYQLADKSPEDDQPVRIESDVWIGTGAIILKGVTVGRGSIVAAGALVSKNVPPYAIVAGVPAKVLRFRWNLDTILRHEAMLYPPDERLSNEYLERAGEI